MKILCVAIIILISVISIVAVNFLYINNVSKSLIGAVDDAAKVGVENADEAIRVIDELWIQERSRVALTVSYVELEPIDNYVIMLKTACENKNEYEYQNALNLLRNAVEEIARLERFPSFQK